MPFKELGFTDERTFRIYPPELMDISRIVQYLHAHRDQYQPRQQWAINAIETFGDELLQSIANTSPDTLQEFGELLVGGREDAIEATLSEGTIMDYIAALILVGQPTPPFTRMLITANHAWLEGYIEALLGIDLDFINPENVDA